MRKLIPILLITTVLFSSCTLFKKDPQKAVNEGIKKLAEVKRGRSKTLVKGVVQAPTGEVPQKISVILDMNGYSDTTDIEQPIFDLNIKADIFLDDKKGQAEVQFRSVNKSLFVKLNSLTMPGEQNPVVKAQVDQLTNTWWQIPLNESPLKQLTDQQKSLNDKFKTLDFFVNAQEEGTDVIEGIDANKYRVEVNKDAVKEFILSIAKQEGNVVSPEEEKAISDSLNDLDFSGLVSVGDDDVVHRIKGTLGMQPDQGALSSFDVDYSGWNFGDKEEVAVPEGAKEFNSFVFLPLIGALSQAQSGGEVQPLVPEVPSAPGALSTSPTTITPATVPAAK